MDGDGQVTATTTATIATTMMLIQCVSCLVLASRGLCLSYITFTSPIYFSTFSSNKSTALLLSVSIASAKGRLESWEAASS